MGECGDNPAPKRDCEEKKPRCPIPRAHKRLHDAHYHWHQADSNYFDPELFVVNLNACIPALRSVTFVLQKQKANIPDFDAWYGLWQERMRKDSVLRWLVEARNRIEKEGDLDTKSLVRATLVTNWLVHPVVEFELPPLTRTDEILRLALGRLPSGGEQEGRQDRASVGRSRPS